MTEMWKTRKNLIEFKGTGKIRKVLEKQVRTRKMEEAVLEDELFYKRKDEK